MGRQPKTFLVVGGGLVIMVFLISAIYRVIRPDQIVATVLDTHNIPRSCDGGLFRQRDNAPEDWPFSYCGGIYTTMGPFILVESRSFNPIAMAREDMIDLLKTGCEYAITFRLPSNVLIYGDQYAPRPNKPYTNRYISTILSVEATGKCVDLPPA